MGNSAKYQICSNQISYRKAAANFWSYDVWPRRYIKWKILHVWFRIDLENKSSHAFRLMKEGQEVCTIAPKDTPMRGDVMYWGHKSFVGLSFLDLENKTFSQNHCHNKFRTIFDFKRFFENLKNGSICFLKRWPSIPDNADDFIQKFHYHWYNGPLLNLSMKQALKPMKELC